MICLKYGQCTAKQSNRPLDDETRLCSRLKLRICLVYSLVLVPSVMEILFIQFECNDLTFNEIVLSTSLFGDLLQHGQSSVSRERGWRSESLGGYKEHRNRGAD